MPAHDPSQPRAASTARAPLAAAALQALDVRRQLLATLTARQTLPINANGCQRAPNAPECPEMSHFSQPLPVPVPPSTCQPLPNAANARHDKTNPDDPAPSSTLHPPALSSRARSPRPLTADQLRAARLLLAGQSTNAVAAALSLNRHTIGKWKRLPLFQAELRRLLDDACPTASTVA